MISALPARILLSCLLLSVTVGIRPQDYDSLRLSRLPALTMPAGLKSSGLPYKVDNSRTRHFPPIFTQYGYSCNQAATISMAFTYEMNALRNLDAWEEKNRYPAFFTWNMMNRGNAETGVSYFESWDMVDAIGCPDWSDYGGQFINATRWMSGYYRYYRGMRNRIEEFYSIDVGTEQGLLTLKHWLFDHMGEYRPGGVANFQIATLDLQFWPLPEGTEDAGKLMIPWFNYAVGHAMTFVGYNDSVRYDFNHDGKYTNDLDTNGDGKVDMTDWEIGALICANTYGTLWGSDGRAYVPYRILPLTPEQGGIWMKSVVVAKPHKNYQPLLTLRAAVRYPDRSGLWITAGVSQDPGATVPQHILDRPVFRYQGGRQPMQGQGPADPSLIEIGIDATPLLGYVEPGKPAAFFLVVCEQDPEDTKQGSIESWSFNQYDPAEKSTPGMPVNFSIAAPFTARAVILTPEFGLPAIAEPLPEAQSGREYSHTLSAAGGAAPYRFSLAAEVYRETRFETAFPATARTRLLPETGTDRKRVQLPFGFPYHGRIYREMEVTAAGGIEFEHNNLFIPYGIELRELLGLHKALYPFYCTALTYPDLLDGVFLESAAGRVTVHWNATMDLNGHIADFNFAARLYPNGTVEFCYGNLANLSTVPWLIGLTGGTREESHYPTVNATGVGNGLNIRFEPPALPDDTEISRDGILTCRPAGPATTWRIPVWLKDYRGIRVYRELSLPMAVSGTGGTGLPEATVKLYPNPVREHLYLEIESQAEGPVEIQISDLAGREVRLERMPVKAGRNTLVVPNLNHLGEGIYLLRVSGTANSCTKFYLSKPSG